MLISYIYDEIPGIGQRYPVACVVGWTSRKGETKIGLSVCHPNDNFSKYQGKVQAIRNAKPIAIKAIMAPNRVYWNINLQDEVNKLVSKFKTKLVNSNQANLRLEKTRPSGAGYIGKMVVGHRYWPQSKLDDVNIMDTICGIVEEYNPNTNFPFTVRGAASGQNGRLFTKDGTYVLSNIEMEACEIIS